MFGDIYGVEGWGFVCLNVGCFCLKFEKGVNGLINVICIVC